MTEYRVLIRFEPDNIRDKVIECKTEKRAEKIIDDLETDALGIKKVHLAPYWRGYRSRDPNERGDRVDTSVMDTHMSMEMARPTMLNQITILAVDPGKVSGWASLRLGEFYSGQKDGMELLRWVDEMLQRGTQFTLVCEDFIYTAATAKKTRQTWSTESIGVLRFLADKYQTEFVLQTPLDAKKFATNDKLKRLDWYRGTKGGHANDAARHLLLYCVKRGLIKPQELI
jgi:hypothetical protein